MKLSHGTTIAPSVLSSEFFIYNLFLMDYACWKNRMAEGMYLKI